MREKYASDKNELGKGAIFSWQFFQNSGLFGSSEITLRQLVEGCVDRPGAGDNDNIPAALEFLLVEPIDFTQSSADTIAHIGLTQLFADGNAYPIGIRAVASGIKHQMGVRLSAGLVQSLEYVVEL